MNISIQTEETTVLPRKRALTKSTPACAAHLLLFQMGSGGAAPALPTATIPQQSETFPCKSKVELQYINGQVSQLHD